MGGYEKLGSGDSGAGKIKWNIGQAHDLWVGKGEANDTTIGKVRYINLAAGEKGKLYKGMEVDTGGPEAMGLGGAKKIAKKILENPHAEVKIKGRVLSEADKARFLKSFSKMVDTYSEVEQKIGGLAKIVFFYKISQLKASKELLATKQGTVDQLRRQRLEEKVSVIEKEAIGVKEHAGATPMGGDVAALKSKLDALEAKKTKREKSLDKTERQLQQATDPAVQARLKKELELKQIYLQRAQRACNDVQKEITKIESMSVPYNQALGNVKGKMEKIVELKQALANLEKTRKAPQGKDASASPFARLINTGKQAITAFVPSDEEKKIKEKISALRQDVVKDIKDIEESPNYRLSAHHKEDLDRMAKAIAKGEDVEQLEEAEVSFDVSNEGMADTIGMINRKVTSLEEFAVKQTADFQDVQDVHAGIVLVESRRKMLDQRANELRKLVDETLPEDINAAREKLKNDSEFYTRTPTEAEKLKIRNRQRTLNQDIEVCRRVTQHTQGVISALKAESARLGESVKGIKEGIQKGKEVGQMLVALETNISTLENEPKGKDRTKKGTAIRELASAEHKRIQELKAYPALYAQAIERYNTIVDRLKKL